MRPWSMLVLLPLLAACEPEPVPQPTPRATADPVVAKQETERRQLLSGAAGPGDFKATFGEPFVGFENRGARMAISQSYEGPAYRVVDVAASREGGAWVFRGQEGAVPGSEPFVLTVEKADCVHEFSGERTAYTAWLGDAAQPRRLRSCAAPAK